MSTLAQEFSKGLLRENPTFRLLLGMCPTLAVTVSAINGFGMGISALVVLLCSNILIATLRNVIPDKVRIPAYILIIATFTTIVDMVLNAFVPDLHKALGIGLEHARPDVPVGIVRNAYRGQEESFAITDLASLYDDDRMVDMHSVVIIGGESTGLLKEGEDVKGIITPRGYHRKYVY